MSYSVELREARQLNPDVPKLGETNPAYKDSDTNVADVKIAVGDGNTDPPPPYHPDDVDEDDEGNCCSRLTARIQNSISNFYKKHKRVLKRLCLILVLLLYFAYFGYAMYYRFGDEGSIRLLWVTCLVVFGFIVYVFIKYCGKPVNKHLCIPIGDCYGAHSRIYNGILITLITVGIIVFIVMEVALKNPYNLVSMSGLVVYVLLCFLLSHSPSKVRWRPVLWGLLLQLIFAAIILKTYWGYAAFQWLGDRVTEFLSHTDAGASFVFGDPSYLHHYFAFKVLPVVVFFSTIISILYYLGAMQAVIKAVAWVMQKAMGTTAAESLNAAANIFIGQTEAPLMIRPLLHNMTRSELHAVMTGGFATIAGSVLAAYILFGAPANHLLSASVMSAPAALAMSKLFYPETEPSKTTAKDVQHMEKAPEKNIIEAASNGASNSVKLVANIAANLIAFLAILHFINATLTWFGLRVGIENPVLTFELICSYLLWPFAFVMGVEVADCRKIAELIGVKTFLNEFIAYDRLGVLIRNTAEYNSYNGTHQVINDDILLVGRNMTLVGGIIADRSKVIATYALCGFSNFGSIGVQLGALGAMAPHRKRDLSAIALRAMIAGNVACFMTACIAGLFYEDF